MNKGVIIGLGILAVLMIFASIAINIYLVGKQKDKTNKNMLVGSGVLSFIAFLIVIAIIFSAASCEGKIEKVRDIVGPGLFGEQIQGQRRYMD